MGVVIYDTCEMRMPPNNGHIAQNISSRSQQYVISKKGSLLLDILFTFSLPFHETLSSYFSLEASEKIVGDRHSSNPLLPVTNQKQIRLTSGHVCMHSVRNICSYLVTYTAG